MNNSRRNLVKRISTVAAGLGIGTLTLSAKQLENLPPEVVSSVDDYIALEAYSGTSNIILVTNEPIRGFFYFDPNNTSVPDGGTIFNRTGSDAKWTRVYDGMPNAKWFRLPNSLAEDSLYHALKYAIANDVTLHIDDSQEEYHFDVPNASPFNKKIVLDDGENLKLFGKGKICAANDVNFLVSPGDESRICFDGPTFTNFSIVINVHDPTGNFELDIQNVQVKNGNSFIFSSSSTEEFSCRKAYIANCTFEDLKGRVIGIKAPNSHDIIITKNVFRSIASIGPDYNLYHNVIDIGHGGQASQNPVIKLSSKIVITENTIENVQFKFKSAAILIVGGELVVIANNVLKNIRGVKETGSSNTEAIELLQTDGIYVKAIKTVISNNVLQNASTGEGAIKVKGISSFSSSNFPGNARGYEVVISNNNVSFSPDFLTNYRSYGTGIMADGNRMLITGNQLNHVSTGVRATPGAVEPSDEIIGNTRIHANQINNLFLHNDLPSNKNNQNQRVARGIYITRGFNHFSILNNTIQGLIVDDPASASKVLGFGIQMVDVGGNIHIGQNNFQDIYTKNGHAISINVSEKFDNLNVSNNIFNNVRTCFRIYPYYQQNLQIKNALYAQNMATNVSEDVFFPSSNTIYENCKMVNNQSDQTCTWQYPQFDSYLSETIPQASNFYENGDIVWRFEPAVGENIGWVFVNGAWQSFGVIT